MSFLSVVELESDTKDQEAHPIKAPILSKDREYMPGLKRHRKSADAYNKKIGDASLASRVVR